jgi:hypothetical protein
MSCLIEQEKIDLLDAIKERRRNSFSGSDQGGSIHGPRSVSPTAIAEMARFSQATDSFDEEVPNSCMQRVIVPMSIPDTSPIKVHFESKTHLLIIKRVCPVWRFWRGKTATVPFIPVPAVEQIFVTANRLEAIGNIDAGMDHVYEAFDKLLHQEGPLTLDPFIESFDADSCTPYVFLAFLTVLGMARHQLRNWKIFLKNLEDAQIVADYPEIMRVVERLRSQ